MIEGEFNFMKNESNQRHLMEEREMDWAECNLRKSKGARKTGALSCGPIRIRQNQSQQVENVVLMLVRMEDRNQNMEVHELQGSTVATKNYSFRRAVR